MYLKTHRAFFRTEPAVDAIVPDCLQMQGRKVQPVLQLCAKYHKWRHPADGMAHTAFPQGQSQNCDKGNDSKIGHQSGKAGSGNPVVGHIEEIKGMDTAGKKKSSDDAKQPENPNDIFDPVDFIIAQALIRYGKTALLQASRRTQPSAEATAEKEGEQEQGSKNQKAS